LVIWLFGYLVIRLFGYSVIELFGYSGHPKKIAQNRLGVLPKNGISFEGITIFLEKILAKTPNPEVLQSIPELSSPGARRPAVADATFF
jgi:hypothetical protein